MLHLVLYALLAVLLAGGLFLIATQFLPAGEQIAPPLRDEPPWELPPDRMLHPDDVDTVRLPVALRGYRFAETDILLDRLAGELRMRDMEIARLRGHGVAGLPAEPLAPMQFAGDARSGPPVVLEKAQPPPPDPDEVAPPAASWAPPTPPVDGTPQAPPSADEETPVDSTPVDSTPVDGDAGS